MKGSRKLPFFLAFFLLLPHLAGELAIPRCGIVGGVRSGFFQVQHYYRYLFKSSRFNPGATTLMFFFAALVGITSFMVRDSWRI